MCTTRTVLTVYVVLWGVRLISKEVLCFTNSQKKDQPHLPKPETIEFPQAKGQPHSAALLRELTIAYRPEAYHNCKPLSLATSYTGYQPN